MNHDWQFQKARQLRVELINVVNIREGSGNNKPLSKCLHVTLAAVSFSYY